MTKLVNINSGVRTFTDAVAAMNAIAEIYERNVAYLRDAFAAYAAGKEFGEHIRAHYPFIRISADHSSRIDPRTAYGFLPHAGIYSTTVTRPDIFRKYLQEQVSMILHNGAREIEVGESTTPIPIHFALGETFAQVVAVTLNGHGDGGRVDTIGTVAHAPSTTTGAER